MAASPKSTSASSKIEAYNPVLIFSGLPLQISCITGYDDNLLVGTKEGHLLIYKITINFGLPPEINFTNSNKYFSRKPIIQLDVIPEYKILISLTDTGITIHDLGVFSCQAIGTIEKTRGASLFVLDIVRQTSLTGDLSITVRMCVVVGRKLQLFYWKKREFLDLREGEEDFCVPEVPRSIAWSKETLCIGFKNEFCLLAINKNGAITELFPTTKPEPVIKISAESFALVQDKKTVLIDSERPTPKDVVTWLESPYALAYDEPYLIALYNGKGVEIRTITSNLHIDSVQLLNAKYIFSPKRGFVFVASTNNIWCLKSTPIETQIESFLNQKQFEIALSFTNHWDDVGEERKVKIHKIQTQYAFDLFCKKKFTEALDIFSQLGSDTSHVIGLFPNLLPAEVSKQLQYPGEVPVLNGHDLEKGIISLISYLTNVRHGLRRNQSNTNTAAIAEGSTVIISKIQHLQIIDTTLLKCYLQTNEPLVSSLLRLKENCCHLEESERALLKAKKHKELLILYQTKNLHRKALEFLQQQNNMKESINYLQHMGKDEMDLILEFSKTTLATHPDDGLKIFIEDMLEVESLPRARIYDFLSKNFFNLVIPYLKHIIHSWGETNALFHNALIRHYRERIQVEDGNLSGEFRNELQDFLRSSKCFTPEVVLVHFPYDDMYEERALILEKIGRHEQALSIYTWILKDIYKGIEYCQKVYDKTDSTKKDVYSIFIKLLLNPPTSLIPGVVFEHFNEKEKPDLNTAIKILHNYAPFIEPIRALNCLHDDIEIQDVQNFLKTSVQNHLSEKRKLLIRKGLVQSEFLRAANEKISCESESFTITDATICLVCKKRFQETNAFARLPDGSLAHYACQDNQ